MTDDISMNALGGPVGKRATASLLAGCDIVLHCNGDPVEMQAVATASGDMTPAAITRANRALAQRKTPDPIDIQALEAEFDTLMA